MTVKQILLTYCKGSPPPPHTHTHIAGSVTVNLETILCNELC
jgi:hypothetical protein